MYNPVIIVDRLLYKPHLCLPGFLMVYGNSVKISWLVFYIVFHRLSTIVMLANNSSGGLVSLLSIEIFRRWSSRSFCWFLIIVVVIFNFIRFSTSWVIWWVSERVWCFIWVQFMHRSRRINYNTWTIIRTRHVCKYFYIMIFVNICFCQIKHCCIKKRIENTYLTYLKLTIFTI